MGGLLSGRMADSLTYGVPVHALIAPRLAVSLPLALMALALALALALPLGVLAAARRGRPTDTVVMGLSQVGVAVPNFWLGILLVLLFAVAACAGCQRAASRAGRTAPARPWARCCCHRWRWPCRRPPSWRG